ncbi:MAG: hypothetical protein ACK4K7_11630 [Allosphingosinicella sp.]|uniref:hypothetical protein n=1 Tax=Allosphingosinicella sp. TaxID=2823234 RepID=UPI0039448BF9
MSIGAERADAQPFDGTGFSDEPVGSEWSADAAFEETPQDEVAPFRGRRALAAILILLALGWVGLSVWAIVGMGPAMSLPAALSWVATASVPLVLLGILWLLFGRSSRRETERFTAAVQAMRSEANALESVLAIVSDRLSANQAKLSEEAARLMALGDEASDRLGRVTHYLARETAELDRKSQALEGAAANARVDIGVLLHDLPRAEEQARGLSGALRETGLAAHEQAGALESQVAALIARAREADESVGGGAQRLAAQIARIESSAGAAAERIDRVASGMNVAVDGALGRASDGLADIRGALDEQGRTMMAVIEQSRAGFEQAGQDAAAGLARRLDEVASRLDGFGRQLADQNDASRTLLDSLSTELHALESRLAALPAAGEESRESVAASLSQARETVARLGEELDGGRVRADALIGRARDMGTALGEVTARLREELPEALSDVEARAGQAAEAARAAVPPVEAMQAATALSLQNLEDSEAGIARQREAAEALVARLDEGLRGAEARLGELATAIAAADGAGARLIAETAPGLIDSLLRVRDAAQQAANHAREAILGVVPESAERLAEASRDALSEAVTEPVAEQLARLELVGEGAVAAARKAAERLTRQLLTLGESAVAIEARFDEERREREEKDAETLSRRVSLLIESLNSTAIDVTKILSNEVTDSAWAAYLKGDRGVFTRRAVRLLDHNDARELLRHYEEEPEFREQVNRYIHDFEALLRRVLAGRDSTPLGITLLSSDMGKLYVALAQAIERIRK